MRRSLLPFLLSACATALPNPVPQASVTLSEGRDCRKVEGVAWMRTLARGRNAWVGALTIGANQKIPLHRDPTEEYIMVVQGSGVIWIDGQRYEAPSGASVYMPAGAEVRFENGPQPSTVIQVFAGPESSTKYQRWKPDDCGKNRSVWHDSPKRAPGPSTKSR